MVSVRISQLAERAGVAASTLRFCESEGLLPAERSEAGYRLYDGISVQRLGFIRAGKRVGLPLEEIRDLGDLGLHHHESRRYCAPRHIVESGPEY